MSEGTRKAYLASATLPLGACESSWPPAAPPELGGAEPDPGVAPEPPDAGVALAPLLPPPAEAGPPEPPEPPAAALGLTPGCARGVAATDATLSDSCSERAA